MIDWPHTLRWNEQLGKYRTYCTIHDMWWQDCPCDNNNLDFTLTGEVMKSVEPQEDAFSQAAEAALGEVRDLPSSS